MSTNCLAQEVAKGEQAADAAVYDIIPESVEGLGPAIDPSNRSPSARPARNDCGSGLRLCSRFAQLDVLILHLRDTPGAEI